MITMRLKTVLTVCLLILLFSCHEERTERSEKTTLMRLSAIEGIQHPHMKAAEYLAKLIERRSGNRMRIQVRSSSAEESIENLLKQLSFGGITMTIAEGDVLLDAYPGLKSLICGDLDSDAEMAYQQVLENIEKINSILASSNVMVLTCYHPKTRGIFIRDEDHTDLERLRMGTVGGSFYAMMYRSEDGEPETIKLNDAAGYITDYTYDAVEAPIIDFAASEAYGFTDSVTIFDNEVLPVFLLMNRSVFKSLSNEEKEIITEASELSRYYADSLLKRAEETLMTRLRKEKVLILEDGRR